MATRLASLLAEARECTVCADHLPLGPRQILRASRAAKILIVGQAPGTQVHETGIPWNDPSGERLREWLGVDHDTFYDEKRVAIMPMGFCYPGRNPRGGDSPPRPECAPLWHARLLAGMPNLKLRLLVGQYAQAYYLPQMRGALTERVRGFRASPPGIFPLPHPSWRVSGWLKRNPWFTVEVLPVLKKSRRTAFAVRTVKEWIGSARPSAPGGWKGAGPGRVGGPTLENMEFQCAVTRAESGHL